MPTRGKRLVGFDVAKAIAIVAVITGHTAIRFVGIPQAGWLAARFVALCFSFHLPVFFIVSGYFLHVDRPLDTRREAASLLIPYVITSVAIVFSLIASNMAFHDLGSTRVLAQAWVNAALYGAGDVPANSLWPQQVRIGAIWFLLALFWSRFLVSMIWKAGRVAPFLIALAFIVGLLSARVVFLPLSIQSGMCAALFVYLGALFRRHKTLSFMEHHRVLLAPCLIAWAYSIVRFNGWGMAMAQYGVTFADIIRNLAGGIGATLVLLSACSILDRRGGENEQAARLMCRVGRLTLLIMCIHVFEDDVVRWGFLVGWVQSAWAFPASWALLNSVRVLCDILLAFLLDRMIRVLKTRVRAGMLGSKPLVR